MNSQKNMEMNSDKSSLNERVYSLTNSGFFDINLHNHSCGGYNNKWGFVTKKMLLESPIGTIFESEIPTENYTNRDRLQIVKRTDDKIITHNILTNHLPWIDELEVWEICFSTETWEKISQSKEAVTIEYYAIYEKHLDKWLLFKHKDYYGKYESNYGTPILTEKSFENLIKEGKRFFDVNPNKIVKI